MFEARRASIWPQATSRYGDLPSAAACATVRGQGVGGKAQSPRWALPSGTESMSPLRRLTRIMQKLQRICVRPLVGDQRGECVRDVLRPSVGSTAWYRACSACASDWSACCAFKYPAASAYTRTLLELMRAIDPHDQNPAQALCLAVSKRRSRCLSVTPRATRTSPGALSPPFGSPPAVAEEAAVAMAPHPQLPRRLRPQPGPHPAARRPPPHPRLPRHPRQRRRPRQRPRQRRYLSQGSHSKLCRLPPTR